MVSFALQRHSHLTLCAFLPPVLSNGQTRGLGREKGLPPRPSQLHPHTGNSVVHATFAKSLSVWYSLESTIWLVRPPLPSLSG